MFKKVILLIVSSCVCFVIAEYFLRHSIDTTSYKQYYNMTGDPYFATWSEYMPTTLPVSHSFKHKTDEFDVIYQTNEFGYLGTYPQKIDKGENVKRILFLGDSFTMGWGNKYEESFVGIISNHFNNESYEVINAGFKNSYSIDSYYAYFLKEGIVLKPDVVVITLCFNDISDLMTNVWVDINQDGFPKKINTLRPYLNYEGKRIHRRGDIDKYLAWYYRIPILRNSKIFVALSRIISNHETVRKGIYFNPSYMIDFNASQEKFKTIAKEFENLSKLNDFHLIWVVIPSPTMFDGNNFKENSESSIILRVLESISINNIVDPKFHLERSHYFRKDAHLNPKGNKVLSGMVLEAIKSTSINIDMDAGG